MAELLRWSGDGLTPGTLTTASAGTGDTPPGAITGVTPSIVNAGPRSPAIQAGGSGVGYAAWALGTRTASAGRVYWTPSALAPSGAALWFLRVVEGSTIRFQVDMVSTGRFNLRDDSQVLQQGAAGVVQPGVTYRVEWAIQSDGTISLSCFEGEGTTPVQQLQGTIPAQHDGVWLGHVAGGAGYTGTMLFDDLLVVDTPTMPGPWVDPNAPAAASPFKYWDGSQYADLSAYVWGGAEYIPVVTTTP